MSTNGRTSLVQERETTMKASIHAIAASRRQAGGRDDGFTLVEIVIAIVLVGILSAVAVVGIGSLTSKGNTSACQASLDAAKAAVVVHLASNGSYPATLTAMTTGTSPAYTLPSGVTVAPSGLSTTGANWTLTMTPGQPPTFACS
jgi:prepilin-type N-terminal cleavage/methylation domain-containing protein